LETVASFEIEYRQFLGPDGKPRRELPGFAKDPAELVRMYRMMTLVRVLPEDKYNEIMARIEDGKTEKPKSSHDHHKHGD